MRISLTLALAACALLIPEVAAAEPINIIVKNDPGLSTAERADVRADAGVRLVETLSLPQTEVVAASPRQAEAALRALQAAAGVEYAEVDRTVRAYSNDPGFPFLWGLENTGQSGGTPDADLDVPEAWGVSSGSGQVVAVVDSGVDAGHPDLAGRLRPGYDWIGDDGDPDDENGHGTHVTGTIVAARDNELGIVGVAPGAAVMPLRVLDRNGEGRMSDTAAAFDRAGDLGIRVVNLSLGAEGFSRTEYNAIAAHPHTLYVVAAGNGNDDNDGSNPDFPCAYDLANVLCVGASDRDDQKAMFSNYGARTVDVFAPGVDILSTWLGARYEFRPGTSMAAPHVAGVAALMLARNPGLSVAQLRSAILGGADRKPALAGLSVSGARVNANGALARTSLPDADGDGIPDASDACRTQAGPGPSGCPPLPPDSDGDGRIDSADACPSERAASADGCPIPGFRGLSAKAIRCRKGVKKKRCARVTVRSDRAATARVTVERKRCKRKGKRKRCRWVRVARATKAAPSNTARLKVKRLKKGTYRAVAVLTSNAGSSTPRTKRFRVR